jgi:hypothetical protein
VEPGAESAGAERGTKLDARGDGVEKVEYDSRLATSPSAQARETGAGLLTVTGGELATGDEAGCDRAPMRGERSGALAAGAGEGVLQTE